MEKLADIIDYPCVVIITVVDSSDKKIINKKYELSDNSPVDFFIRESVSDELSNINLRNYIVMACRHGLGGHLCKIGHRDFVRIRIEVL